MKFWILRRDYLQDNALIYFLEYDVLSMIRIYRLNYFNIYSNKKGGFIVNHIYKEFQNGHTHINNYNTAKYIIQVALHKSLPNTKSVYIIDSLIRISNDNTYINELKNLKEKTITEKQKRKEEYNDRVRRINL